MQDIDLKIEGKSLTAIVGSVGSGKSSLCQAILGEMSRLKGDVTRGGKVAYVAQQVIFRVLYFKLLTFVVGMDP